MLGQDAEALADWLEQHPDYRAAAAGHASSAVTGRSVGAAVILDTGRRA
jgi:hypothetical protein